MGKYLSVRLLNLEVRSTVLAIENICGIAAVAVYECRAVLHEFTLAREGHFIQVVTRIDVAIGGAVAAECELAPSSRNTSGT